jgi:hypothetical protein
MRKKLLLLLIIPLLAAAAAVGCTTGTSGADQEGTGQTESEPGDGSC